MRGAATLKARALKEVWNIAAVIPVEKGAVGGGGGHHQRHGAPKQQHRKLESNGSSISDDVSLEEENNFLGICSQELLARGTELLKRTRKGNSGLCNHDSFRVMMPRWKGCTDVSFLLDRFAFHSQAPCTGRLCRCTSTGWAW